MANIEEKFKAIYENVPLVYESGYQKGLKEGNNAWDFIQDKGNRTLYQGAFCGIDLTNFYPPYPFAPTNAKEMFRYTQDKTPEPFDLEDRAMLPHFFDFSQCEDISYAFYQAPFTRLPYLDLRKAGNTTQHLCISDCTEEIAWIELTDEGQPMTNFFYYAESLKEVRISGTIAYADLNLKNCKNLSLESLRSILTSLKNVSDSPISFTSTVFLSQESWELLNMPGNGYDLSTSWVNYLYDIGWSRA